MAFEAVKRKLNLKNLLASIRDSIGQDGRYWRWGTDDNFPNIVIDSVNDSGTARDCIDKLETFIAGEGIVDKEFLKKNANPQQTWEELLTQIDRQLAYFDGITLQVKYNRAGEPAAYYCLPIQHIRKRYDGQFIYAEDLGDPSGFHLQRNWNRKILPPFGSCGSPSEVRKMIAKQIAEYGEQLGELLYIYIPGVGLNYEHYPVPKYSAGLHDINADAGLSLHEESQVANSFKAGVIVQTRPLDKTQIVPGTGEGYNEDGDEIGGKTEYDMFTENMERFCSPDGSPVFHIESITEDGQASVTPLNIQHQMDATEKATDRIGRKVCRLFGVPPVLIGFATAGKLGDTQELVHYMKLFKLTLKKKWQLKTKMFSALFPNIPTENFEVRPLELFEFVNPEVIKRMTPKQMNEAFDLPEDQEGTAAQEQEQLGEGVQPTAREVNEHLKTLTGKQQQQLDRVVRKYNKGDLSEQQAVMQLTGGFGFTEDEARTYLGIESEGNGVN